MTSNALHSVVFQIPTKKHSYMLKVENDENCTLNREHRTIYIKHKTCNSSSSSYLLRKKLQLRYNSELFRLYTEAKLWFQKPITYHRDCTFHGFFTSPTPPTAAFCENEYSRSRDTIRSDQSCQQYVYFGMIVVVTVVIRNVVPDCYSVGLPMMIYVGLRNIPFSCVVCNY